MLEISNKNETHINPIKISLLLEIVNDCHIEHFLDNTFITFKSNISNIIYLIYSTYNQSIISYNLNSFYTIAKIKNAHNKDILNFRHYYYKEEKKDLIMSISYDNNIKIWDNINWDCILNLENINISGGILSSSFLYDNGNIFIISSNFYNSEPIKIFDLKGNKLKEISQSNENTYFIDTYFDDNELKLYIIAGHFNCMKSYDYKNNTLYKKYFELNTYDTYEHCSAIIYSNKGVTTLIDSCCGKSQYIRIWDFHSSILIKKIFVNSKSMGMALFSENYLIIGCLDKTLKLVELSEGKIITSIIGHKNWICTIRIINHNKYGKCLISQGRRNDKIKLWILNYY